MKIAERLQECEAEILATISEVKQRPPGPLPPYHTNLQVSTPGVKIRDVSSHPGGKAAELGKNI